VCSAAAWNGGTAAKLIDTQPSSWYSQPRCWKPAQRSRCANCSNRIAEPPLWSLHLHLRAGDSLLPTLEQATFGGRDIMMKAQHSLG